jgi:hypothetical protein
MLASENYKKIDRIKIDQGQVFDYRNAHTIKLSKAYATSETFD